ncbi:hypothetical protein L1987_11944 [Smallanthus sonchifolius]|uniref:Uncharacterized protein n=1 Tax=Smallanthus sonchifolius TaxID=185202 RepID=A0ACB9JEI8_9ASTR|nr:hypothetical protein L1987_11944 [Smallanthus sonchifolius]
MEINQQISSSSPGDEHQHLNPDDSVHQSAADEVSFGFNHLQIDTNDDSNSQELMPESPETDDPDDDDDEEEEEEGDFTFVCVGENDSPTMEFSEDGQIRTVFPLFDQSLLLGGDYDDGKRRLPIEVPVDKVFIESRPSPLKHGETDGTVRALSEITESGSPEVNMKSNSTGFSKIWRFRNEMNRSNSDSRDAFVFLERLDRATTSEAKTNAVGVAVGGSTDKVNAAGGGKGKAVRKGLNTKKSAASAHEIYLKQKGEQTEDERRRSYLPYRPGLMGFFTNVNGGLSKNVHPF